MKGGTEVNGSNGTNPAVQVTLDEVVYWAAAELKRGPDKDLARLVGQAVVHATNGDLALRDEARERYAKFQGQRVIALRAVETRKSRLAAGSK
jgi:hypothetical protein